MSRSSWRREILAACFVLGLVLAWVAIPAVSLAVNPTGAIEGYVTDASSTPLSPIAVSIYSTTSSPAPFATTITDGAGHFQFQGLASGRDYFLYFNDSVAPIDWAPQFFDDRFPLASADPVHVSAATTTSVDATMTRAAVVSARIHRIGHPATYVGGAKLELVWWGENPDTTLLMSTSNASGLVASQYLHPGPWMVWAYDPLGVYGPYPWAADFRTFSAGTTVTVDIGLPLIPITVSNYPGGWVKEGYHFNPTVADGDLPPYVTYSKVGDGGASIAGFNLSEVASQSISFWSVDASGNVEATKTCTVHVDGHAPVTTCDETSNTVVPAFSLEATDALSGVAATYYSVDLGPVQVYAGPVALPAGTHDVLYWSVDVAGNSEAAQLLHVLNPPAVKLGKPVTPSSVTHNVAFKVYGSIAPLQKKGDRSTKLWAYRWTGSSWTYVKAFSTTSVRVAGKSRYTGTVKLGTKGKWRLIAYSPGTYVAGHWPGRSAAKIFTVK